jgi:3-isopropylmalate/(R)-2-methylmalate dehydratase small subunit
VPSPDLLLTSGPYYEQLRSFSKPPASAADGQHNIDTDQIIPARFLKTTTKEGLDKQLFCDWRYDAQGNPKPDFILNHPRAQGAQVLVAGDNFGCGSSREHAPWALTQFGFRAVVSTSFADIFKNNSLKNGLLPIVVDKDTHATLMELAQDPNATVLVDLASQTMTLPDGVNVPFPVDAFSKHCLLEGVDELGYILQQENAIAAFEKTRVGTLNTLGA